MTASVDTKGHGTHVHVEEHDHGGPGYVGAHHPHHGQLGHGAPVLDIGGDIGALILYTSAELEGREIEVSPLTDSAHRTHTEVLRRTVGGRTFWAGVYAALPEGEYQVWYDDPARQRRFAVLGGQVTELDWR
jgi:hypothetical protein